MWPCRFENTRFKLCLREEISSRLRILRGAAPQDAREYRNAMLALFLTRGNPRLLAVRLTVLASRANGDWRNHEH